MHRDTWDSPEEFKDKLTAIHKNWKEAKASGQTPLDSAVQASDFPSLVLCVVEQKAIPHCVENLPLMTFTCKFRNPLPLNSRTSIKTAIGVKRRVWETL